MFYRGGQSWSLRATILADKQVKPAGPWSGIALLFTDLLRVNGTIKPIMQEYEYKLFEANRSWFVLILGWRTSKQHLQHM